MDFRAQVQGNMNTIKILFTSVGRRVELMQRFRKAAEQLGKNVVIIGGDMSTSAPALFYCDKRVQVCRISDENYIPMLLDICAKEEVNLLIPTIDTDLLLLAKSRKVFEQVGTKVLISAPDKIAICRDKRYTADFFVKCGLNTPIPVDDVDKYEGPYPCFIKPKDGSSSINAYKVESEEELFTYAKQVKDYIIQPFIEGKEYTVDICCDFDGQPIYITPRERMAVRSGEVLKTCIVQDEVMIAESRRIVEQFKPCGPITVQLIKDKNTGENYYIEINPRFGGGAPLSMMAGADSATSLLKLLTGENVDYKEGAARNGEIYSRFDQSVCVSNSGEKNRKCIRNLGDALEVCMKHDVVIFDLDDTLYSEKDYVRSGFKAVARMLNRPDDIESQLWKAFEQKQNAIDVVLQNNGIWSEMTKKECVETYRRHTPELSLYQEAKELLHTLLAAGKKVGIITDGRPEGQWAKINQLGLKEYASEIIVTDELAGNGNPLLFRKPSEISFEIMRRRMECAYEDMVYVGDNVKKDFVAPERLGMATVWFQNVDGLYN